MCLSFDVLLLKKISESLQLVCEMLDQVIGMHTDLQWIHIGCDEVVLFYDFFVSSVLNAFVDVVISDTFVCFHIFNVFLFKM